MDGNADRMQSKKRKTINVTVYRPAPIVKPSIVQAHRAADVVSPLIWLRELKSIELPLIKAADTIVAADMMGMPTDIVCIK